MPSILNSDDGVVSGTSGLKSTGSNDGLLNIQSNGSTILAVTGSGIAVTGTMSQTGVSTFAAGTAAAPSITFTGDTNTGIFSPTADTIAFSEGGAEAMRIDSSGNVGIGVTPSPWVSTVRALEFNNTAIYSYQDFGFANSYFLTNAYLNSSSQFIYKKSNFASVYAQEASVHKWYTAPSGTAGNAITFTQVLAVEKDKSLALQGATSQSGAGITFPATQSASSDANTLDDYEEGDFTATATPNAGGSITLNSSINTLSYTKVGRVVTVCGWIQVSSVSGPSGSYLEIGGLPFALADLTEDGRCAASVTYLDDSAGSYTVVPAWGQEGQTKFLVFQTQNTIAASDAWVVNFSYFAS